jgi:carboxypeptidase C (cathepsin A)
MRLANMRVPRWARALLLLAAILVPAALSAQRPPSTPQQAAPAADTSRTVPADAASSHSLRLGDRTLDYSAVAGMLPVRLSRGGPTAHLFYTSYRLDGAGADRPVTFVFNGGPGAASAFLHLGAMGPRVVNFSADGAVAVQPVALADNPDTWLTFTDLVFVDPVATGYSRVTGGGEDAEKAFLGVDRDADTMAEFVRLYLAKAERPLAPVFLAGESYGGFRAALVADRLLGTGTQVRGAVLISPALEFSLLRGDRFALLPEALSLPSIAAAHLELKNRGLGPEQMAKAEQFALSDYLAFLATGYRGSPAITAQVAEMTGLAPEVIARHHGRVSRSLFIREYEQQHERTLSRYDASVSAPVPQPARGSHFDPILEGAVTVLAPAFERYAQSELGFRSDQPYQLLNGALSGRWDYGTSATRQGFAGALDDLQGARTKNPALRILVASGYTDFATPYFMARYLIDQLQPIATAVPVEVRVYRGGHMMYLRPVSRHALMEDVRELYRKALEGA